MNYQEAKASLEALRNREIEKLWEYFYEDTPRDTPGGGCGTLTLRRVPKKSRHNRKYESVFVRSRPYQDKEHFKATFGDNPQYYY